MTCNEFEIQVQDDHLSRIAQTPKPILVLSELIWNAVDADATRVDVTLISDDLDGLVAIEVPNNRHGTPWTKRRIWSRAWVVHGNNRALQHGRLHSPGQGRAQVASPAELHTLPDRGGSPALAAIAAQVARTAILPVGACGPSRVLVRGNRRVERESPLA